MSLIIKTEAIVLRTIKYSETSKIVTLYTKELGRIGAIVKGVRKRDSKYGSSLEPMSHVQVVLYVKEGREVQLVSQLELLKSFHSIANELEKISIGLSLVEIVNTISHEQEQNVSLFILLKDSLLALSEITESPAFVLWYFELKLAELLGFHPVFDVCGKCKRTVNKEPNTEWFFYNVRAGSPVCDGCAELQQGITRISKGAFYALATMSKFTLPQDLKNLVIQSGCYDEIEAFLTNYLQVHVSGFRLPRSRKMLR